MVRPYREWHKILGCDTCLYCNRDNLYITGCCSYHVITGNRDYGSIVTNDYCRVYEFYLDHILGNKIEQTYKP